MKIQLKNERIHMCHFINFIKTLKHFIMKKSLITRAQTKVK